MICNIKIYRSDGLERTLIRSLQRVTAKGNNLTPERASKVLMLALPGVQVQAPWQATEEGWLLTRTLPAAPGHPQRDEWEHIYVSEDPNG